MGGGSDSANDQVDDGHLNDDSNDNSNNNNNNNNNDREQVDITPTGNAQLDDILIFI